MFIAALFAITKKWKRPDDSSADKWVNKMWSVHPVEYYSAVKRNRGLT